MKCGVKSSAPKPKTQVSVRNGSENRRKVDLDGVGSGFLPFHKLNHQRIQYISMFCYISKLVQKQETHCKISCFLFQNQVPPNKRRPASSTPTLDKKHVAFEQSKLRSELEMGWKKGGYHTWEFESLHCSISMKTSTQLRKCNITTILMSNIKINKS